MKNACDLAAQAAFPTALLLNPGLEPLAQGPRSEAYRAAPDRDQLVLEHMKTVSFVARRVKARMPEHVELDELIAAGMIGLIEAATRFDPAKQVQFKSYAQIRIQGAILDSLRTQDWSPRELRRQGRAIAQAGRDLSVRLGRSPGEGEIADELGLDLEALHQLKGALKGLEIRTLDEQLGEDSDETEADLVPAPERENPLRRCIEGQTHERVTAAVAHLPERERLVLSLSFYEELTLKEIGLILGVGESRVSQIRGVALARLRRELEGGVATAIAVAFCPISSRQGKKVPKWA